MLIFLHTFWNNILARHCRLLIFLFTCAYLERPAGCFSSICHFRFAVVDLRSCFFKPSKDNTKRSDFSHLDHHWPFHKIVLSNHRCHINGGGRVQLGIVKNLTIWFDFYSLGHNSIQYQLGLPTLLIHAGDSWFLSISPLMLLFSNFSR